MGYPGGRADGGPNHQYSCALQPEGFAPSGIVEHVGGGFPRAAANHSRHEHFDQCDGRNNDEYRDGFRAERVRRAGWQVALRRQGAGPGGRTETKTEGLDLGGRAGGRGARRCSRVVAVAGAAGGTRFNAIAGGCAQLMKMGYSRRVAGGAFSVGFAVSIHSERGLQAAEACVLCGSNEFPDYFIDSLTGERWCGFGWFGTLAANGCFCGLKAALLFPARHRYGLVRTRNWNSRKKRKETQRGVREAAGAD